MKTTRYLNDNAKFDFFEKDYFNRLEEIVEAIKNEVMSKPSNDIPSELLNKKEN